MSEMTAREVQLNCLEILKVFDALCRDQGLTYFLSGGTLIGAVRHKGFIPWDDDVDVMMPRSDYERLAAFARDYSDDHYALLFPGCDRIYNRPWARMADKTTTLSTDYHFTGERYGNFIDIFPVDGMPAGKLRSRLYFKHIRLLDILNKSAKRRFSRDSEHHKLLKKVLRVLLRPFGAILFARRMNRVAMRYSYADSAYRGVSMTTHYGAREKLPAEVFDHAVEVDFEGCKMPAPCGWDAYLTALYGDYMKIPKEHENDDGSAFTHYMRYARAEEKQ